MKMLSRLTAMMLFAASAACAQDFAEFNGTQFGKIILSDPQSFGGNQELEHAISAYNNEPITNYSPDSVFSKLARPVGRLDVLSPDRSKLRSCTAFLVEKELAATSLDCLAFEDGPPSAAQMVLGYREPGVLDGVRRFLVVPEPVESVPDLGLVLLPVAGFPEEQFGTLALDTSGTETNGGDPLWIIGAPMGGVLSIAREGCRLSDDQAIGSLQHVCDTLPGNEGSPIFVAGSDLVVGMHRSGTSRSQRNTGVLLADAGEAVKSAADTMGMTSQWSSPTDGCLTLFGEVRTLGCAGYDAFLAQCPDHPLSDAMATLKASVCEAANPPGGGPGTPRRENCVSLGVLNDCLDIPAAVDLLSKRSYAFNAPETLAVEDAVQVSLVIDGNSDQSAEVAVESLAGSVQSGVTPISLHMEAELVGPGFKIEPGGRQRKQVSQLHDTRWDWRVTGLDAGQQELQVALYVIFRRSENGEVLAEETVLAEVRTIEVTVTAMGRLAEWIEKIDPIIGFVSALGAVLAGALAWFGIKNFAALRGQKPQEGPMRVEVTLTEKAHPEAGEDPQIKADP